MVAKASKFLVLSFALLSAPAFASEDLVAKIQGELTANPAKSHFDIEFEGAKVRFFRNPKTNDLSEVRFSIKNGRPLNEKEIARLTDFFSARSIPNRTEVSELFFDANTRYENRLTIEDAKARFIQLAATPLKLKGIDEEAPATTLSNLVVDGPVEVPAHQWRIIYFSFEHETPQFPEFGITWYDFALYRDGFTIRLAKQANFLHAIVPSVTPALESLPRDASESTISQIAEIGLKEAGVESIEQCMKILLAAGQPTVSLGEVRQLHTLIKGMMTAR